MMRKMTMSCRLMIILVLTTALLLHWGMNEAFAQTGAVKITPSNGAYVPDWINLYILKYIPGIATQMVSFAVDTMNMRGRTLR